MICHLPRVNLRPVDPTSIDRSSISFEVSALSNDLVDDISTMFPTVHYSPSSIGMWSGDWVTDIAIVGAGDNARFSFEIDTPLDAELGNYDLRVQWTDAAGQTSDWLTAEEAFYLQNSLPRVLGNGDMTYAGVPTVKVGTSELVSVGRSDLGCRDSVVQSRRSQL